MEQRRGRPASRDSHQQRIRHELLAHDRLHRPAQHVTREQIEHYLDKELAFARPEVREHRDPLLCHRSCVIPQVRAL
jgi:hypothetical protein